MPIVPSRAKQIQELLSRLDDDREAAREGAVARLTLLGPRAVAAVLASLRAASPRGRLGMLAVLERLPDPRALPEILALFRAREPEVARKAVELAGVFPQLRSVAPLARVLSSGPPGLREPAAQSLARIHAAGILEAIDSLLDVLLDDDEDEGLRLAILETLSPLPAKTLLPILKRLRTTPSPALAARVAALRQRGGGPGVGRGELEEKVGRLLDAGAGEEALIAELVEAGEAALDVLLERLDKTRRSAEAQRIGRALPRFGEGARGRLHGAIAESQSLPAQKALALALGQLHSATSIPVLHRTLEGLSARAAGGGEATAIAETKAQIHVALAALDTRIALYDLRDMLRARPPWAATTLLAAAARIGEASVVPAIVALAHDQPGTVDACAAAFGAIAHREKLRRTSPALRGIKPEHRDALEALWARQRGARRP